MSAVTVFTPEEEGPDPIEVCETNIRHLKNRYMYAEVVDEYKALIKLIDDDKDQDAIHEMYDYIIGIDNYAADDSLVDGLNWARQMAVARDPSNTKLAQEYMDYLCAVEDAYVYEYAKKMIDYTENPVHQGKYDEACDFYYNYYMGIKGAHTSKKLKYVDISDWYKDNCIAVDANGLYYVLNHEGKDVVSGIGTPIMSYTPDDNLIAIMHKAEDDTDEQLVYTNPAEQRKRVPYIREDEKLLYYSYLGPFSDGLAVFSDSDGKWGYLLADMSLYLKDLEAATTMQNSVCAIKRGGKWQAYYIAGGKANVISGFDFGDIMMDESYCFLGGFTSSTDTENITTIRAVFYARDNSSDPWTPYEIVLVNGDKPSYTVEKLGRNTYSDVKLFGDTAGAVKTDNGWIFIDNEGELLEFGEDGAKYFANAGSFSCGVAPVSDGYNWGYINELGNFVIEPQYRAAGVMNSQGSAVVWKGDDDYYLLRLREYYN